MGEGVECEDNLVETVSEASDFGIPYRVGGDLRWISSGTDYRSQITQARTATDGCKHLGIFPKEVVLFPLTDSYGGPL